MTILVLLWQVMRPAFAESQVSVPVPWMISAFGWNCFDLFSFERLQELDIFSSVTWNNPLLRYCKRYPFSEPWLNVTKVPSRDYCQVFLGHFYTCGISIGGGGATSGWPAEVGGAAWGGPYSPAAPLSAAAAAGFAAIRPSPFSWPEIRSDECRGIRVRWAFVIVVCSQGMFIQWGVIICTFRNLSGKHRN